MDNKISYYTSTYKDLYHLNTPYSFHFNGQEADDEIAGMGNIMSAEFWEYDTRLGRRWNRDPVVYAGISPYAVLDNNPISFVDPLGLDPVKPPIGPPEYVPNEGPDPYRGVLRWIQILDPVTINGGPKPTIVSKVLGWIGRALNVIADVAKGVAMAIGSNQTPVLSIARFAFDEAINRDGGQKAGISDIKAFRTGQMIGDAFTMAQGLVEGGIGTLATTTGVLAPAGIFVDAHAACLIVSSAAHVAHTVYMVADNANGNTSKGGSEGGNYKTVKGNDNANEVAEKLGYEDAHDLKREYVGSGNEAKFDIQVDRTSGKVRLVSKDQKTLALRCF